MAADEFAKVIRALAGFHGTGLDLSAITVPTLVLDGEHDAGFIPRHAPRLGAAIPNATVRKVPGGGHASNLDEPEFFTAAVREFLDGLAFGDAGETGRVDRPDDGARAPD